MEILTRLHLLFLPVSFERNTSKPLAFLLLSTEDPEANHRIFNRFLFSLMITMTCADYNRHQSIEDKKFSSDMAAAMTVAQVEPYLVASNES